MSKQKKTSRKKHDLVYFCINKIQKQIKA